MSLEELYGHYALPLRIAVVDTSFSHPENFVNRSSRKGEVTNIDDPEGSWMNAGAGGESNTVDLTLQLQDATGKHVTKCDIIPIKCRLWCCQNGYVVDDVKEEISQAMPQDRSGHRRGKLFMVSGKASSELHILHNGSGFVCVRITTTSQLNDRRRFTIEIAPDLSPGLPNSTKLGILFAGQAESCKPGDTLLHNCSLSKPIEVMSKINKLAKKRETQCNLHQAQLHLEKALDMLKDSYSDGSSPDHSKVPKLLTMCRHIRDILCTGQHRKLSGQDDIPQDVIEDLYKPLDHSTDDVGILDLASTEATEFEEMVGNYMQDSQVVDCLYTHNNMYVTLDHHTGQGKIARGVNPFSKSQPLYIDSPTGNGGPGGPYSYATSPNQTGAGGYKMFNGKDSARFAHNISENDYEGSDTGSDPLHPGHHYQILKIPFSSSTAQNLAHKSDLPSPTGKHHHFDPKSFVSALHDREDELKRLFSTIDTNHDGYISYQELITARNDSILKGSDEDIDALHRWMNNKLDDGLIDFEEFRTSMTLLPSSTTLETLVKNFRVHEENERLHNYRLGLKRLSSTDTDPSKKARQFQ